MAAGREAFVARYGGLFEHSPWVAEAAYERGPFSSREELLSALTDAMRAAPLERRVALIRAHPDLAGKAAIEGRVTADSAREQGSAGLDRLTPDEHEVFTRANAAYRERFGFPFVICVARARQGVDHRLRSCPAGERPGQRGRGGPGRDRQDRQATTGGPAPMRISYGKLRVPLQRVVANEDGRHDLLAAEVSIEVLGENFEAAYTEGDNREVVATDTMKNFILREALAYDGATLEGLLLHLGRGFLETYPVMNAVRMSAKEVRFDRLSDKLFARERGDHAVAMVELDADGIRDHRSGREDLWMLKVTGSSFTRFARDEYTTLPERVDRPLFVSMDVHWRLRDPEHDHVDPRELREQLAATFDDFVSESIQHLVHEMGTRALERWPQAGRDLVRGREPHARPARRGGHAQALHGPVPRAGTDHADS